MLLGIPHLFIYCDWHSKVEQFLERQEVSESEAMPGQSTVLICIESQGSLACGTQETMVTPKRSSKT